MKDGKGLSYIEFQQWNSPPASFQSHRILSSPLPLPPLFFLNLTSNTQKQRRSMLSYRVCATERKYRIKRKVFLICHLASPPYVLLTLPQRFELTPQNPYLPFTLPYQSSLNCIILFRQSSHPSVILTVKPYQAKHLYLLPSRCFSNFCSLSGVLLYSRFVGFAEDTATARIKDLA
jgi:hypothetical protein